MSTSTWICTNNPWHDFAGGLTCRWCDATRTPAEAIVSGLASRRGGSEDAAKALVDAHRAEVLREAADLFERAGRIVLDGGIMTAAEAAERLRELAGEKATADAATATPDFFEPGHSYTHRNGSDFRCVTVTAHPQTGERLAMGWHVDSWGLHYPTTVGINQWRHEYDGVEAPIDTEAGDGRG
jgi:hypothetical protein